MENGYQDPEFGRIDDDICRVAESIWETGGQKYGGNLLDGDEACALRLLLKAAAATTRKRAKPGVQIENLDGYLRKAFRRELLAQLEQENSHRRLNEEFRAASNASREPTDNELDEKILIQELMRRMDPWTLNVFRLLTMGHSFEEIAQGQGKEANSVRSRYSKNLQRLKKQIEDEQRGRERGADENG
jgi:DNA-directed RNA polymerase specialized sigma24 family protein